MQTQVAKTTFQSGVSLTPFLQLVGQVGQSAGRKIAFLAKPYGRAG